MNATPEHPLTTDLIAVLVAVTEQDPAILTIQGGDRLPSGPFESGHRSLQSGLRAWVEQQTHHPLGYVEQLYTFADRDRTGSEPDQRIISVSYLGLTREAARGPAGEAHWRSWYRYFPWEDHRTGHPTIIAEAIAPDLHRWAEAGTTLERRTRLQRAAVTFGLDGHRWNEELVLQRYELLHEAGLVAEARRRRRAGTATDALGKHGELDRLGWPMMHDHRRILATGIARLRAKIKYRPVVFELMPPSFTLLQLQRVVEALAGRPMHKQNFRRLIEQQELVEETGQIATETGGRPAKLFRFRGDVLLERAVTGTKLPVGRT